MNNKSSRSLIVLVVSLVVLAVIGYLAYARIRHDKAAGPPVSQYDVQAIDTSTLPDRFPGDLPLPEGATVTRNEVMTDAEGGRFQETRTYLAASPLKEQKDLFAAYFAKGWTVSDTKDLGSFAAFLAERDGTSVQVSMIARGASTEVTIIVTAAPASSTQ